MFVTTFGGQLTVGIIVSTTVTVAIQFAELPFPSSTVSVMLLAPRSTHVNVKSEADKFTVPQLSVEPPSISAAMIDTVPAPSK